jgi:hypothetical protein
MAMTSSSRRQAMLAVTALAAVAVLWPLDRGWMPSDDGMLAMAARRLNAGELPHRDFDEVYTGGLTWLNAWAFHLLGERLSSLRAVLFAFFVAWVPAVQFIGTRFLPPWRAALVTALAVAWTVPNYPAAMPSWYNLFFATFSAAALLRYVDHRRRRWLFAAGAAAGISVLFKVIGVFAIAAGLLAIVWLAREESPPEDGDRKRSLSYSVFVTVCLILFVGGLLAVVRQALDASEVVNFVLPGAMVAAALIASEWSAASRPGWVRLFRLVLPFAIGVAIPLAIFLVPFVRGGAGHALVHGVFILPQRRFAYSANAPLPPWTMLWLLPFGAVALWLRRERSPLPAVVLAVAGAVLAAIVFAAATQPVLYRNVWYAARSLPVLVVAAAAWHLARARTGAKDDARLVVLVAALACGSLVQFPYSAPVYFCYAAPLLFLALVPWAARGGAATMQVAGLGALFFIAFAVTRINGSPLPTMGERYEAPWAMSPLPFEQGGIEVPDEHARVYAALIPALEARARGGYTWAAPDSPEIYFLSGLKNPTREVYDFFNDSPDREATILQALDEHGVTAVVLNRMPFFSPPISRSMYAALARRYPRGQEFGPFVLLWSE